MKNISSDSRYTFITGVIRAMERNLLGTDFYGKLIKSGSADNAYDILKTTVYGEWIFSDTDSMANLITGRRLWLFGFIEKYSFHREISSLIRLEYDYHNCRILLKEKIFEIQLSDNLLEYGTINRNEIINIFEREDYKSLPETMAIAVYESVKRYYDSKNPFVIDLILDRAMMNHHLAVSDSLNSSIVKEYFRVKADCINFQILSRLKNINYNNILDILFLAGGSVAEAEFIAYLDRSFEESALLAFRKNMTVMADAVKDFSSNPFAIERATDRILKSILYKAQFCIFGIDPLFSYSQRVIAELKYLQMIIAALRSGADASLAEKRIFE